MIDLDELERQLREARRRVNRPPRLPVATIRWRNSPASSDRMIPARDRGARRSADACRRCAASGCPGSAAVSGRRFRGRACGADQRAALQPPEQPIAPPPRPVEAARPDAEPDLSGWNLRPAPASSPEPELQPERDPDDRVCRPSTVTASPMDTRPLARTSRSTRRRASCRRTTEVYEEIAPKPRRKGLYAVGPCMGVAVVGIVAAAWRCAARAARAADGLCSAVIKAEAGPMKVQPANPGGVVVPNQDNVIFTAQARGHEGRQDGRRRRAARRRRGEACSTATAARRPRRGIPRSSTSLGHRRRRLPRLKPSPQPTGIVAGLGEPRKVRTVSVRPDGTIIDGEIVRLSPHRRTGAGESLTRRQPDSHRSPRPSSPARRRPPRSPRRPPPSPFPALRLRTDHHAGGRERPCRGARRRRGDPGPPPFPLRVRPEAAAGRGRGPAFDPRRCGGSGRRGRGRRFHRAARRSRQRAGGP